MTTGGTGTTEAAQLPCIEPFIATKCATSDCHDAETQHHGLDLSTGPSIYESLVDRNGLDPCGNTLMKRVAPGDPDNSLLIQKVTGRLRCEQSQRMPPPPDAPLTEEEIGTLRTWIAMGAPPQCDPDLVPTGGSGSGGAPVAGAAAGGTGGAAEAGAAGTAQGGTGAAGGSGGASGSAGTSTQGGSGTGAAAGAGGDINTGICTSDKPCGEEFLCAGNLCSETWECFAHSPEPESTHPCSMDIVPFCGCDGVTFEAPYDCPTKPWLRFGPCEEGHLCDPWRTGCDDEPPVCPEGQLPSVVDECWGECVPFESCRCLFHYECGDVPEYACDQEALTCNLREIIDNQ